jgi:hypothetical protein
MFAECAIAVSVCAAGYIFLVDPVKQDLAKVQSQVAAARAEQSQQSSSAGLSEPQVAELRRVVAERAEQIQARSNVVKDQSALFGALMALGVEHKIRIDQLQPGVTTVGAESTTPQPRNVFGNTDPAAGGAAPTEPPKPRDTRMTCTLVVQGSYANITNFLAALQRDLGYTNILDVRLNPAAESGPNVVAATIQTEHFAFDLSSLKPAATPTSLTSATPASNGARD